MRAARRTAAGSTTRPFAPTWNGADTTLGGRLISPRILKGVTIVKRVPTFAKKWNVDTFGATSGGVRPAMPLVLFVLPLARR